MKTYFLDPYSIRKLFDSVANRYDLLNHLLSMGRDFYWRRVAAREITGLGGWILDNATGTGDVAIEIIHQEGIRNQVFGLDFSEPMVKKAQQKLAKKGLSQKIALSVGDALFLPFRENTFSASLIAFGLRNILNKEKALSEMVRVTREGGKVVILEFTFPRNGLMRMLYPIYFKKILPWVGGVLSGDKGAYTYLPESVLHFRNAGTYEALMNQMGLEQVHYKTLTSGIASIITGTKTRK